MTVRIAVIGGGSYHWAPRLLADFANTPSLAGVDVVLHDLDAERMKRMEELGNAIAQRDLLRGNIDFFSGSRVVLATGDQGQSCP